MKPVLLVDHGKDRGKGTRLSVVKKTIKALVLNLVSRSQVTQNVSHHVACADFLARGGF